MKQILSLVLVLIFTANLQAQEERLTASGVIGTNYGIIQSELVFDIDRSWHPGIIIGTQVAYRFTQTLSVESGLHYEMIRLGQYRYENLNPGDGYGGPTYDRRYTVVNKYNYLTVPLNLSYRFWGNLSAYAGVGYRFELKNTPTSLGKKYTTEPIGNIGLSYKIDDFKVSLGYTAGLRDGALSSLQGFRTRTFSFTLSYPIYYK